MEAKKAVGPSRSAEAYVGEVLQAKYQSPRLEELLGKALEAGQGPRTATLLEDLVGKAWRLAELVWKAFQVWKVPKTSRLRMESKAAEVAKFLGFLVHWPTFVVWWPFLLNLLCGTFVHASLAAVVFVLPSLFVAVPTVAFAVHVPA